MKNKFTSSFLTLLLCLSLVGPALRPSASELMTATEEADDTEITNPAETVTNTEAANPAETNTNAKISDSSETVTNTENADNTEPTDDTEKNNGAEHTDSQEKADNTELTGDTENANNTEQAAATETILTEEPVLYDQPVDTFDVPTISDEIEALGVSERAAARELYQILRLDDGIIRYGSSGLEAVYDPRTTGGVSPVQHQGSSNTCWAFSSLAAGEQSLLVKNAILDGSVVTPETLDLSEAQLTYFFYHQVHDPLSNTTGDSTTNISSLSDLLVGSSTIYSTFQLANWIGAVDESFAPFENYTEDTVMADALCYASDSAHLQNAYWINFKDTDAVNSVKQMIKQYGAVAINFRYLPYYFNPDTCGYYLPYQPGLPNNHSVTIVGWDDTYPASNFSDQNSQPVSDGAWIAKNSYGSEWGENGYFYISYEDNAVNTGNTSVNRARAYVFDFVSSDTYQNNYQYDGTAGAYNCSYPEDENTYIASGGSIANVFTVPQTSYKESLEAVSFALYDTAVSYSIQIYKNPTDETNPSSGTPMLSAPQTGMVSYVGYYTIPLDETPALSPGDTFAAVITLSKESGSDINFFVDATYQNGNWVQFTNSTTAGESFKTSGSGWQDLNEFGMTARIKVMTNSVPIPEEETSEDTESSESEGSASESSGSSSEQETSESSAPSEAEQNPTGDASTVSGTISQSNVTLTGTGPVTRDDTQAAGAWLLLLFSLVILCGWGRAMKRS